MTEFAAFLRAINVGHRRIKMDRLRMTFESLGFEGVSSHIASGNIRFSTNQDSKSLEAGIEAAVEEEFGFFAETFVRTITELKSIVGRVPFTSVDVEAAHALLVCFLKSPPTASLGREIKNLSIETDRLVVVGRELYWLRTVRESDPMIQKSVERVLGAPMTGRKLGTVLKMMA